ncbi:MAG: hypothetical protein IPP10_16555 [Candidatus Competibacteraceae bacterium]|nr:hypothetical protein [Candidatus Competibacteraceae bacterium]
MAIRFCTATKSPWAQLVFQSSINLMIVRIQTIWGSETDLWTSPPAPGIPFLSCMWVAATAAWRLPREAAFLSHELTHVWQGQHGFLYGYVFNSALHQTLSAILNGGQVSQAYGYTAGRRWSQYATEQQASIVADWFSPYIGKRSTGDSRYRYIRDKYSSR